LSVVAILGLVVRLRLTLRARVALCSPPLSPGKGEYQCSGPASPATCHLTNEAPLSLQGSCWFLVALLKRVSTPRRACGRPRLWPVSSASNYWWWFTVVGHKAEQPKVTIRSSGGSCSGVSVKMEQPKVTIRSCGGSCSVVPVKRGTAQGNNPVQRRVLSRSMQQRWKMPRWSAA
jgi:hypothetical protein